jgi:hypothetical protein
MNQIISYFLLELRHHWQAVLSIVSIFIALIAYWDSRQNRRLSARPYLEIIREFDTTKEFIGITLSNHSSAVGIIGEIIIEVNSNKFNNSNILYLDNVVKCLNFIGIHRVSLRHLNIGAYVGSGKEYWLIKVPTKNLTLDEMRSILFELDKIKMKINYSSIYKESFFTETGDKIYTSLEDIQKEG